MVGRNIRIKFLDLVFNAVFVPPYFGKIKRLPLGQPLFFIPMRLEVESKTELECVNLVLVNLEA